MNASALELPVALRKLVDSRLDAIERALLQGNTPRVDRRAILEDIETQIIEMVATEAAGREPTRADLLRVLARLDPPEAFAEEQGESGESEGSIRRRAPLGSCALSTTMPGYSTTGILACVGGLVTLIMGIPLCALTMVFSESEILIVIASGFFGLTGMPTLVLGILYAIAIHQSRGQLRGLTCAAIGISALPIGLIGLLGGFLVIVSNSEVLIFGGFALICVLAVVGAIHLTYRSLELLVHIPQRQA